MGSEELGVKMFAFTAARPHHALTVNPEVVSSEVANDSRVRIGAVGDVVGASGPGSSEVG